MAWKLAADILSTNSIFGWLFEILASYFICVHSQWGSTFYCDLEFYIVATMCLRQKIYCDSNSTKNVGCNNSYSNSTSSPSFWTHQPTWYESVYWSEIRYSLPALCPPILHFCQKCLNARQKLGTRNSKVWMLLKTVKNLKNSKVTHSHSLTLSFYHSLAILLSHSLSLDMLNNFCLF